MTDYVQVINFTAKDALSTGDPNKKARGTHIDGELSLIATAIASKLNSSGSGASLTALNATQLTSGTIPDARLTATNVTQFQNTTDNVGYLGVPQSIQAANYTCVLTDASKHIYHASGAGAGDTYTIPANASVAYPLGAVLTFINSDSNSISIAVTTDTMTMAGTTTTGTRTLAQNGIATAVKVTTTGWLISGPGLS